MGLRKVAFRLGASPRKVDMLTLDDRLGSVSYRETDRSLPVFVLQYERREFGLTLLFIAHDLSVIKHISDRIAVMYLGRIVEMSAKKELFGNPKHPYTQALLSAIPIPDPRLRKKREILMGDVPSSVDIPLGCRFNTRCTDKTSICLEHEPDLKDVGGEHLVACHLC